MAKLDSIVRLRDLDVAGRRVLVRADLDGPRSPYGAVTDDGPLRALLPTLRHLLDARAKVLVASRFDSTDDGSDPARGVAARLAELLGVTGGVLSHNFTRDIPLIKEKQVALLPNLASFPEEAANDADWAETIARAIDVYVLDGLRAAQRATATTDALPKLVAERGAGHLVGGGIDIHRLIVEQPVARFGLVLGGSSARRVLPLAQALLPSCTDVLFGGAVGNTVLVAQGWKPGASPYDAAALADVGAFLDDARARGTMLHFPVDAVVRTGAPGAGAAYAVRPLDGPFGPGEAAVDVAVETCVLYRDVLARCATALWVGLMGDCSVEETQSGSVRVGQAVAQVRRAVIAGDDTVAAAVFFGQDGSFRVAPGGDAALAFLAGDPFPGLDAVGR